MLNARNQYDLQSSVDAFERTKRSVGSGVSSGMRASLHPVPLFVDRGHGSRVWDISGNEFVDYVMGWGPLIAGHSHPAILEAVSEAMSRMQMIGLGHRLEYEAAESVLEVISGADRLLWSNTGTEAVQIALRLARAATGRNSVVKFVRSYHGWADSVFASVGKHDGGQQPTLNSDGQNPNSIADLIVLEFNDFDAIREVLGNTRERGIAAVLIDPIMSNAGVFEPAPGFLEELRRLCDESGTILIFDQVIAGFRIALGGATERYSVVPDLSVFGKAIAGGFSQAAVAGKAEIVDLVDRGVVHAGTYNGNPVALAAVKATLTLLREDGVYDRLEKVAAITEERLQSALTALPGSPTVRRVGALIQVAEDETSPGAGAFWPDFTGDLLHRGIVALPTGKTFVSTAHTEDDADQLATAIIDAANTGQGSVVQTAG